MIKRFNKNLNKKCNKVLHKNIDGWSKWALNNAEMVQPVADNLI